MAATYANAAPEPSNPIANAKLYWKISGPVLAAVAGLGFALNLVGAGDLLGGFLTFDITHNLVHTLLAVVALYLGFSGAGSGATKAAARTFGVVYLGLGVVGLVSSTVFGLGTLLGLHLEIGENLVHLTLGAWGAYAGFSD